MQGVVNLRGMEQAQKCNGGAWDGLVRRSVWKKCGVLL